MRERVYKITNDDDPMDCYYPLATTGASILFAGDVETYDAMRPLRPGQSVTVGGGAAVQFTITRIR